MVVNRIKLMNKISGYKMDDMVQNFYKKGVKVENGVEGGVIVSDLLNSTSCSNMEQMVQYLTSEKNHRTLQQNYMRMIVLSIKEFANKEFYDGRNEASVMLAKKLAKVLDEEGDYLPLI